MSNQSVRGYCVECKCDRAFDVGDFVAPGTLNPLELKLMDLIQQMIENQKALVEAVVTALPGRVYYNLPSTPWVTPYPGGPTWTVAGTNTPDAT